MWSSRTTRPNWSSDLWLQAAVRLTATAEADFREILRWTLTQFGKAQARAYAETLSAALNSPTAGPTILGARERHDIARGLYTLHVARKGRKGRHFLIAVVQQA
jgi:toxin ParE1/3/4